MENCKQVEKSKCTLATQVAECNMLVAGCTLATHVAVYSWGSDSAAYPFYYICT
jgi:hypothetical protein